MIDPLLKDLVLFIILATVGGVLAYKSIISPLEKIKELFEEYTTYLTPESSFIIRMYIHKYLQPFIILSLIVLFFIQVPIPWIKAILALLIYIIGSTADEVSTIYALEKGRKYGIMEANPLLFWINFLSDKKRKLALYVLDRMMYFLLGCILFIDPSFSLVVALLGFLRLLIGIRNFEVLLLKVEEQELYGPMY